jgi:hypothetical protein
VITKCNGDNGGVMADATDILLKHWEDRRAKFRHSEDQRSTLTNMVLVIASIGFGLIGQRGMQSSMLAVTVPRSLV